MSDLASPYTPPPQETVPDLPPGGYVVVYRESDRLLADAQGTDVPILAWGKVPEDEK